MLSTTASTNEIVGSHQLQWHCPDASTGPDVYYPVGNNIDYHTQTLI